MPETPELPRKDAAYEPGELVTFPGAREYKRPQNTALGEG